MSLTPMTPNLAQSARAFWDKPEGTFGKAVLVLGGLGLACALVFFWGIIVTFLLGVVANTIELALLLIVGAVLTSPIWSSSIRADVRNIFQSGCRMLTGLIVENDPIGMLKNNIANLQEQLVIFGTAISKLAGAKQTLEDDIARNVALANNNYALSKSADKQIVSVKSQLDAAVDPNRRADLSLQITGLTMGQQGNMQAAGMALKSNETEQKLLNKTNDMYNNLRRLNTLGEYKVKFLVQQADFYTKQRKVILASQSALGAATKIMKGDPKQLEMVDMAIDYLNNEASDTIGALSDFNKWVEPVMMDMDLQNGADADLAAQKFKSIEAKLTVVQPPSLGVGVTPIPTYIPDASGVYSQAPVETDYNSMFNK